VRILFDQGTPVPLRSFFHGHDVVTAFEMGWSEISNGELLAKAEERFDLLLTTDKQLRHQQKLAGRSLAILILPHASWIKLQPHADRIVLAATAMQPGVYSELHLD
jgi:hypothetical protein